ncbi:MAG TPA: hypothetical protein VMF52_16310 [Steroidobacteraceae bacterium]|nr:hypothetical protein [Steroidobacteraceae bacterium]
MESDAEPDVFTIPRYRDNPEVIFIEMYVHDTIAPLPPEFVACIAERLGCTEETWRETVQAASKLSNTFDIAVLDLWYRNAEIARSQGFELIPLEFSRMITDNYMAHDTQIDVWLPGAFDAAVERIKRAQGAAQ